jgi:hypothetical protein
MPSVPSRIPVADDQVCHNQTSALIVLGKPATGTPMNFMPSLQRVLDIDSGSAGAKDEGLGHPDLKVKTGPPSHALLEDASNEETLSSDPMEDEGVHPQHPGVQCSLSEDWRLCDECTLFQCGARSDAAHARWPYGKTGQTTSFPIRQHQLEMMTSAICRNRGSSCGPCRERRQKRRKTETSGRPEHSSWSAQR